MEWLDGHPLSMRLILPRLDTAEPEALLAGLRGTAPLPDGDGGGDGRTTSLAASVSYSFTHLAEATRRLLPAVCLFQAVANAGVLSFLSQVPGVPERFRGATEQDWGRPWMTRPGSGCSPAWAVACTGSIPRCRGTWPRSGAARNPKATTRVRDAATRALLTAHADIGGWLYRQIRSGDARLAYAVIGLERRTLGSLLGYALDHKLWGHAQQIAQPLDEYWDARGLDEEAEAWADRARLATEGPNGTPPQLDTPAGALWLFFTGSQANREVKERHLDDAERTYRRIVTLLQAQPTSPATASPIRRALPPARRNCPGARADG